jgi:hypothetical protein
VFRDVNTGNLIYVSETGGVAVAAAKKVPARKAATTVLAPAPAPKAPDMRWQYRLRMKVRPAGEVDFDFRKMVQCNVEVYRETDSGRLIYLADYGNLAVSAAGKDFDGKEAKEPEWSHAHELRARKTGEQDFRSAQIRP